MELIKKYIFLIVLVIGLSYQLMCAMLGFDMSDDGFVMTLYRDYGDSIDAGKTGSGYPLACYLGWCFMKLTPGSLLAMRLWGIFLMLIMTCVIYFYLKKYFPSHYVALGLLGMMFLMGNDPKTLGYNNFTIFFATLSIICILEGVIKNRLWLLVAGGVFIGVNTFIRLPNILEASFAIIPFVAQFVITGKIINKKAFSQFFVVLVSTIIGGAISWMWLVHIGADSYVVEFLGTIGQQLNGDSSHSSFAMIEKLLVNYGLAILMTAVYILTIVLISVFSVSRRWIKYALTLLLLFLFYRTIYIGSSFLGDKILALVNGIGILGALIYIWKGSAEQKIIAISAAYMSFVLPLGSDQGFVTMWNGVFMSFPIGFCGTPILINAIKDFLEGDFYYTSNKNTNTRKIPLRFIKVNHSIALVIIAVIVTIGIKVYHKCYYDPGDRHKKTYAINSPFARGIYTAKDKADRINPLLKELKKYVNPGDTMLVYDWSPMLYCLTGTKAYAGISWPCVFYGEKYAMEIEKAEKKGNLPIVVLQNYRAIDETPSASYYNMIDTKDISEAVMVECINRFINKYGYRKVWSNIWYEILLPPDDEKPAINKLRPTTSIASVNKCKDEESKAKMYYDYYYKQVLEKSDQATQEGEYNSLLWHVCKEYPNTSFARQCADKLCYYMSSADINYNVNHKGDVKFSNINLRDELYKRKIAEEKLRSGSRFYEMEGKLYEGDSCRSVKLSNIILESSKPTFLLFLENGNENCNIAISDILDDRAMKEKSNILIVVVGK